MYRTGVDHKLAERRGDDRPKHGQEQQVIRSGLKTPSKAQGLRCVPLQNAHILLCMLRFFLGKRLVLKPNLRF